MQVIVGLGNPSEEYQGSRHNVGKDLLHALTPQLPKKAQAANLNIYMNNSGTAVRKLIPSAKAASGLIVLHDDLDLPLGSVKISFGSGSGGHRGVESIIKALKTKEFVRIRIGISPKTPSGKLKKPDQKKVVDFVLGQFKPAERAVLKKVQKTVGEALELLVEEGIARAMTEINSR
jgi:PTH1 family peptidyl-tRNA hydrolase